MAPSPVVAEGEGDAALRVEVSPKINAAFGEGSTVRRPGRLRVMHPHVAEFLRIPRRLARPARKPAPAQEAPVADRPGYGCAFEDDEGGARGAGLAAPGRLVWGKVRHHPWWPGQVFDAADASALALAHRRPRRAVLVAYFGDDTFAWNEKATLRPFRAGFARLPSRRGTAPFAAAVDTALDEVARRVEAGLSCCCGGKGEATAKRQVIDNAGVREGAYGAAVDAAFKRGALRGEAFVGYISALATAPLAGADRVDLTIATAQLKALDHWRGSTRGLPEYSVVHGIDGAAPGRAKRRRSPRGGDGAGSCKRRMSRSSAKGNAARDGGDYEALELEDFPQPTPQQMSTKIGKLMNRAAQQMSLSPMILRARANGNAPPPAMPNMARCARVADELPPMNNGDPSSGAMLLSDRRPAAEMEHHAQVRACRGSQGRELDCSGDLQEG
ncbi:hypothetical protein PVAP13_3NG126644 [Panicum virgatum]|uniref:PWWP domain-containing protein n=1 Tax=Panicum virgatum TaxID=38727 RepID=A0A8T0U517_PANVG|nr:hypothetical protein PVAP13_3NG126644 [Panicum virgatum]